MSRRTGTALPKVGSPQVQQMAKEDPNYFSAYNICLLYEEEFAANANKQRHIRILGYLLLNAPNRAVRSEVTRCIHSRQDDSDLVNFGALFERHVILPCEIWILIHPLASCTLTYLFSFSALSSNEVQR